MADEVKFQSPIRLTFEALVVQSIRAEKHNKRQKERNVTTQVSANEIKQYLPHTLEQRTSSNVINKRENLLEKKKNQRKIRIKGIQNKDILRNKNHLQKQAEKNFTDEGDQLFKMGIKVLQQSKRFLSSYGIGMEYDQAKALIYYTFGSAGGSIMSQMILGYRYLSGINVLQNCEVALSYYKKVVSLGQLHLIGRKGLDQDYHKALHYFLKAAKAGSANAMAFIGKMYLEGNTATPQNNATAFKYFSMAASKGNAIGLHGLGLLYFYGKGVPVVTGSGIWKDYKLAFKYFYLASQSGQPLAIYYLAEMYATGTGVVRSCRTAVEKRLTFLKKRRCIQWRFYYGIELPFKDIHLARRLYDMAAQTSPDAYIPVFLALMKLETMHLLRDILFFNFTMRWNWLKPDNTVGPHWDLFVIGLIVAGLILLLRNHRG
uniref:SEL1L2 adaptor subunit of SYVN1 ubiquitin ligase n=1 Tax=Mandrillus leucophaeus TaxID=9568 RepID=A0A2K5YLQ6_MANLE